MAGSPETPSAFALPAGWTLLRADGPGPFTTGARLRRPDGTEIEWNARLLRKRAHGTQRRTGTWWRPDLLSWWIGVLFAIGSACFTVAPIATGLDAASAEAIGITYFVGSLFFTTAAFLSYLQVVNTAHGVRPSRMERARRWRPASWEPGRIDWGAAVSQLIGTLFFNVNTFASMRHGFDIGGDNLRIWAPDAIGSALFLLSSEMSYAEVCRRWVGFGPRTISWWITALNMLGSIAFGVSAVAAFIEPSTQEPVSAAIANTGTAVGGICFFIGALLLLPEARRANDAPAPA